jgi:hypothetical protein
MNRNKMYAGNKIPQVTANMGIKNIANMQGTTRIIYDSIKLQATTTISAIQFFENVNTRKFPFANIPENKLQVGETIAMQRFSLSIIEVDITNPAAPKVLFQNPISYGLDFQSLYRSDLSIAIAQDTVVKKLPIHAMYAPFNKDSRFVGSETFGTNPGPTLSFEKSHDVFHFDNPIVIPPQIEFTATIQVTPITLPVTANREWHLCLTIEGLGSLFAPKSNY